MNKNRDGLHNRFRSHGLRITEPRKAIIDLLSDTKEHLSAEEIYMEVHKGYPGIGLTTVYRTLELLEEMGVIYRFHFGDGRSRYELIQSQHKPGHHHHLICTNCKRIIDYDDFIDEEVELLNKVEKNLTEKHDFKITGHVIQFYGTCSECQK
ncbi:MAG: Fur family transcriptional regulator [Calditrichia bacterium]|jgi:Fur family ferric uptake transcriptional regulator